MSKSIIYLVVALALVAVLAYALWGQFFAVSPSELISGLRPVTADDVRGTVLAEGWDDGADTFLMDVPALCPAQRLEYTAWQKYDTNEADVEFIVSQMGNTIQTDGAADFTDIVQDGATWALSDDSVYALTVRGRNARWRFSVACE